MVKSIVNCDLDVGLNVLNTQPNVTRDPKQTEIINLDKYSGLRRVLHVTAWVQRFVNNARRKETRSGALTTGEIHVAERYWIKVTQSQNFPLEIEQLKKGEEMSQQSKIKALSPFLDEEGVLRIGCRLQMASWSFEQKHPCILLVNTKPSELQVKKIHEDVKPSGLRGHSQPGERKVLDN